MNFQGLALYLSTTADYLPIFGIKLQSKEREVTVEKQKFSILDSIFFNCSVKPQLDGTGGGAIAINRKFTHGIIDRVVFDSCFSSRNGGAIYLKGINSEIQICCTIALRCVAINAEGNFAKIDGRNNILFNLSSISLCGNSNFPTGSAPISLSGFANSSFINSSVNDCFTRSGAEFTGFSQLKMSSFVDNSATDACCLNFLADTLVKYVNIIKNSQLNQRKGIIKLAAKGTYTFTHIYYTQNTYGISFEFSKATVTVINSSFDIFTTEESISYSKDNSLSEIEIKFFIGNPDVVLRSRAPRRHTYNPRRNNRNEMLIQYQKRRKQWIMFFLLSIVVVCLGILALLSSSNDDLPEDEPLLKRKKKAGLSPMNAIV